MAALRFQALKGASHKQLKSDGTPDCHCPVELLLSHCSLGPKYAGSCMHMCTGVTFFPDWMLSFTWIGTFLCVHSFPTLPVILQTCHSFKSFQTEESFGPSCLQRQESSSLMADIKENTCSLETHLRPSNSLNNPPCPSPSDNTHWVLRHHYLQSEMTRHNPNAGRSF